LSIHQHTSEGSPVCVVLVGGLDPGTGAGVARDLLTATALGAIPIVVGTAWTEQGPSHVIEPRDPERVRAAFASATAKVAAAASAVKIGMVATAEIARVLTAALASHRGPTVYDPVLRASSGGLLYDGDRESLLDLACRGTLLTPNLAEAEWLLERPVRTQADARAAARALHELGIPAVLVKGGHLEGEATDVLRWSAGESLFSAPRIPGPSPRGTGCALATAIAVHLATGETLDRAVASAKTWLGQRMEQAADVGGERRL
jgi:hydroxymethylpyrimidine/phosphomethylpyrimidine kinase